MTDTKLLEEYINNSGLKRGRIASSLGITVDCLRNKTKGKNEFKASEIRKLIDILAISDSEEVERIFFAKNVEYNSTL